MFSKKSNASKIALHAICKKEILGPLSLVDCQMPNEHLESLGMTLITREAFEQILASEIKPS
jgi:leucyl/phenylalanyl-tRNA--protein transferase